jgi:hypothetical protein
MIGPYQNGFNISYPEESKSGLLQEPVEPEKSQPSDLEKAAAISEGLQGIAEPVADALKRKNDMEENLEQSNAARGPGYADHTDPSDQQNTAPKQAEATAPSESVDDGYDYYNGVG